MVALVQRSTSVTVPSAVAEGQVVVFPTAIGTQPRRRVPGVCLHEVGMSVFGWCPAQMHQTVFLTACTSTTVADLTGGVCNGIAGLWLGGAVSTATRTG